jgi:hypothetical protein
MSLFTTWAARTGRVLRAVPVSDLDAEELIDFWADDRISYGDTNLDCRGQAARLDPPSLAKH